MLKIETSTHINRPVDEVFDYLADPAKLPEWNTIVESATPSGTPIRAGTTVRLRARFLGKKIDATQEVTEFERPKRYVNKTNKPFPLTTTTTVTAEGGGSKVVAIYDAEPGAFFRFGESIVGKIAKKQLQAQLDTVKDILEALVPAER